MSLLPPRRRRMNKNKQKSPYPSKYNLQQVKEFCDSLNLLGMNCCVVKYHSREYYNVISQDDLRRLGRKYKLIYPIPMGENNNENLSCRKKL